jgi:choline monooxygenase
MDPSVQSIVDMYRPSDPLDRAWTIPGPWYTDERLAKLEQTSVFAANWHFAGRVDQVAQPGQFLTTNIAGEPIVVVRGQDKVLRAFFNVCRHHAAEVAVEPQGTCSVLRCPYHGWTYDLDGKLKGAPEFEGVCDFDRNGLVPIQVETWESFVFVKIDGSPKPTLREFLGDAVDRIAKLNISNLHFFARQTYTINCNWKVYADNYLDGGYHIPHLHKSLNTVIEYKDYIIENGERYCLQSSPMRSSKDEMTSAVRRGDTAYYYWFHPNFMLNWYEGVMDTNLVIPLAVDKCEVIFDFYFADVSPAAEKHNRQSLDVAQRIQQEDIDICESVQRGLGSRAYRAGRLSVRREAGEHLFHRLLHQDLSLGQGNSKA